MRTPNLPLTDLLPILDDLHEAAPQLSPSDAIAIAAMETFGLIVDLTRSPNAPVHIFRPDDDWTDFTTRWIAYRHHVNKPADAAALADAIAAADHYRYSASAYRVLAEDLFAKHLHLSHQLCYN